MITVVTEDHVFHSVAFPDEDIPEGWANPQFAHRRDWSIYCEWCEPAVRSRG